MRSEAQIKLKIDNLKTAQLNADKNKLEWTYYDVSKYIQVLEWVLK